MRTNLDGNNMKGIGIICLFLSLSFIVPMVSGADETGETLLDGKTIHITSGDSYLLHQKYIISAKSVSEDGSAWLQLTLNDEIVKSEIVEVDGYFIYNKTNTTILSAKIDNVYAGSSEQSLVSLSPIYQYIDPDLPTPVLTAVPDENRRLDNNAAPAEISTPKETLVWMIGTVLLIILFYILRKLW